MPGLSPKVWPDIAWQVIREEFDSENGLYQQLDVILSMQQVRHRRPNARNMVTF